MERIPPLSEMLQAVLRHVTLLVTVITAGLVLAVFYAMQQPKVFQTSAVVQIGQEAIQREQAAGTNGPALQRLQEIEQRVMARDNLVRIIEQFNLYGNDPSLSMNDRVFALRLDTTISQITDPAYRWRPDVAPTALLIEVTNGDPVLASQVANVIVAELVRQSSALRSDRVARTLEFFDSEEARIDGAIIALDAEIAAFKEVYAESLPEVIASQREKIVTLEEQELDLEQEVIEAQNTVRPDRGTIARLEEQLANLRLRKAEVQAAIAAAPQVEQEYNALLRQLQQLNDQYDFVARSRAEAEMGQMLEESNQSSGFVVLEEAQVPEHPVAPNRKKIVAMGGAIAFALAIALIVVLELRNPVLRTASQMQRQLGIQPVVSIPAIEVRGERLRRRLLWLTSSALVVLLGVLAIQVAIGSA